MCFSASASFAAAAGLAVLGGVSLHEAKKEEKILALIPLLFAVQQAFEGFQWLHLYGGTTSMIDGYGFLFFAFIFWPIYVPAFVYILDRRRRSALKWPLFLGVAVGAYFSVLLLTQPIMIAALRSCVSYTFDFPFKQLAVFAYVAAVLAPLFLSSKPIFRWFGLAVGVLALVSWLFYAYAFASVWCFFAAIVSSMFYWYIKKKGRKN